MSLQIYILSALGMLISLYGVYFTNQKKSKDFKPFCDISDKVSCSKAFESDEGSLFGIKNYVLGIIFYLLVAVLVYFNFITFAIVLSIISVIVSIYLAYILLTKVKSLCVICISTYIINIAILLFLLL